MSNSLGEATLGTGVDLTGMKRGLDQAEGQAKRWSAGVGNILKAGLAAGLIGVGVAAAGSIVFLKDAVLEAGDYYETLSKQQVTFGEQTDNVNKTLTDFANSVGRSSVELNTMATDQGAVLKSMGLTTDQAAAMSTQMTQLAVDVGSFTNVPAADVADRFTRALTGEFESLKTVGIVLNQSMVQQELLNMGIKDNINTVDQATKAQAIMNLITQATTDAQGDAARTSDSWANQMVALKSALKDTKVQIGSALLPVLRPLLQSFTGFAREILPQLVDRFTNEFIPALQTAAAWVSENIVPAFMDLYNTVSTFLQPIIETISTWLGDNLPLAFAFVQQHSEEFKGALLAVGAVLGGAAVIGVIGLLVGAIGALLSPIGLVIAAAALLGAAWAGDWGGIREKTAAVVSWIRDVIITPFLTWLQTFWAQNGAQITATVTAFWQGIKRVFDFWIGQVKLLFSAFSKAFSGDWKGFGEDLRKAWDNAWNKIKEIGSLAWDAIVKFFKETDWGQIGHDILTGVARGITSGLQIIKDAAIAAARAALDAAKGFLGIGSPSKVFAAEVGYPSGQGQAIGYEQGLTDSFNAAAGLSIATPVTPGGGGAAVTELHLHVGTLIADDAGLMKLEATLERIRQTEDQRRGIAS